MRCQETALPERRLLAGSVSARRRQEADLRRDGPAGQRQLGVIVLLVQIDTVGIKSSKRINYLRTVRQAGSRANANACQATILRSKADQSARKARSHVPRLQPEVLSGGSAAQQANCRCRQVGPSRQASTLALRLRHAMPRATEECSVRYP